MFTPFVTTTPRHETVMTRIERALRSMIEAHAERRARRIEQRELARLGATSDHLLLDIGVLATEAGRAHQKALFPTW